MLNVRLNINMTMTKAPPSAAAELETLMADVRRLSLESSAAWTDSDLTLTQMRALAIIQLRQPITVGALSALMGMSLASGSALASTTTTLPRPSAKRSIPDAASRAPPSRTASSGRGC